MAYPHMLPEQQIELGQLIEHEGKSYEAAQIFNQGKDAKNSQYTYFMKHPKGVMAFKEI